MMRLQSQPNKVSVAAKSHKVSMGVVGKETNEAKGLDMENNMTNKKYPRYI